MNWNGLELPEAYYQDDTVYIIHGDCREVNLQGVSAIVTDPPYELNFMNKGWDNQGVSFKKETWAKLKSYCKSGAPLLSFGGTRTYHRIACATEDAGWELRDCIMWVYGSGFPKSLDISKAIDKQFGADREVIGEIIYADGTKSRKTAQSFQSGGQGKIMGATNITSPSTPEAKLWEGYGTALKPAYEPIILAMNPLNGTFANNALKEGVAGLNIDECRIPMAQSYIETNTAKASKENHGVNFDVAESKNKGTATLPHGKGRFPANFIHDGSQSVMELFPDTGKGNGGKPYSYAGREYDNKNTSMFNGDKPQAPSNFNDSGSAARFFYCAKASRSERDAGLEDMPLIDCGMMEDDNYPIKTGSGNLRNTQRSNNHPTVKPLALMEYLVKLVKMPQYNLILDPFCGSGTTLLACKKLEIPCIGIDNDEKSCEIASKRCS